MAPRFVEVVRPIDDGVAWASDLMSTVNGRVSLIGSKNTSSMILKKLGEVSTFLPNIKIAADLRQSAISAFDVLPQACSQTKYFFIAALLVAILRWLFLIVLTRTILANYGANKVMNKEM